MKALPLVLASLVTCVAGVAACAALEHDAQVAEPVVQEGCTVLKLSPAPGWVDVACSVVAWADDLIANYPAARKVQENTVLAPDGGVASVTIIVRLPVASTASTDAGRD